MGTVETVTGKISGSEMGVTLPHEHIFLDMRSIWSNPITAGEMDLVDALVSPEIMGRLRHNPGVCKDNLVLDDPEMAAKELLLFKAFGGKAVVDATTRGLLTAPVFGRPVQLRDLSKKTGLNIIAGTGYYTAATHPPEVTASSVDDLAREMIRDIQVGLEGTDVKAGMIGELGVSYPIAENERKVLRSAAQAQVSTGVAVSVHLPWRGRNTLKIIDLLESCRVDPGKIIICHMDDVEGVTFKHHRAVAERGVYLSFDCFGQEDYVEADNFVHPRDTERIVAVKRLIDAGYVDNLLLSQDVCLKTYTRSYGGYGYDHIQRTVVPMLGKIGVTEAEIHRMVRENPQRVLAD